MIYLLLIVICVSLIAFPIVIHKQQMKIDKCFYFIGKYIDKYCEQGTAFVEMQETLAKLDTTYKSAINTLEDQIAALDKDLHSPYFGTESEEPKGEVWSND